MTKIIRGRAPEKARMSEGNRAQFKPHHNACVDKVTERIPTGASCSQERDCKAVILLGHAGSPQTGGGERRPCIQRSAMVRLAGPLLKLTTITAAVRA
jgi:hypothetical protein